MLLALRELYGETLAAKDGELGRVHDFLFLDSKWMIKYLVADTRTAITGGLVLLTGGAFHGLEHDDRTLSVNLTRQEIEGSLPLDSDLPINLQGDERYRSYHQPPSHWMADLLGKTSRRPYRLSDIYTVTDGSKDSPRQSCHHVNLDLWSTTSITGYNIHCTDGQIGHLSDLGMDDERWSIRGLYVKTGVWFLEKEVFIDRSLVERVNHPAAEILVNLTKAELAALHRDPASEYGMDAYYACQE